ncbi:hypothetical protein MIMGU_mgv11b024655mg [Erythranthe guttata]|uniref:Uncharacterized protein n=1 Tax=Erythranthe guttata TaxID=4155 RepID=A0A022PXG9_ERYGU|nr:hypothetical protein MIMGU_mgv11b024655mg [Erythranthe guttata]
MPIKVLVLYFVFLRTLLRMHFCDCSLRFHDPFCQCSFATLLRMHFCACFFTCTFVHVHLSECVCAGLFICINVLGL